LPLRRRGELTQRKPGFLKQKTQSGKDLGASRERSPQRRAERRSCLLGALRGSAASALKSYLLRDARRQTTSSRISDRRHQDPGV
jgi:hypothetical protein